MEGQGRGSKGGFGGLSRQQGADGEKGRRRVCGILDRRGLMGGGLRRQGDR